MNHFDVEEISSRDELGRITDCIWEVMEKADGAHKVFFPVLRDRETALTECKERLWREHENDPTSHWIFVRDASSKTLRVLGACQWRFHEQNPFPQGMPDIQAVWWPEGEGRDFGTEFVRQCLAPRAAWMAKPHTGLSWCVVLPEHQRKGIGQSLMSWGLRQTDDLGLESYIEASSAGRKLYEGFGYRIVARVDVDMKGKKGGKEWEALEKSILPFGYEAKWRLPYGDQPERGPQSSWKMPQRHDEKQL